MTRLYPEAATFPLTLQKIALTETINKYLVIVRNKSVEIFCIL
jgi:hypothetical protein